MTRSWPSVWAVVRSLPSRWTGIVGAPFAIGDRSARFSVMGCLLALGDIAKVLAQPVKAGFVDVAVLGDPVRGAPEALGPEPAGPPLGLAALLTW